MHHSQITDINAPVIEVLHQTEQEMSAFSNEVGFMHLYILLISNGRIIRRRHTTIHIIILFY